MTLFVLALVTGQVALSNRTPESAATSGTPGTASSAARADHAHKGVRAIYKGGDSPNTTGSSGDVALVPGAACTLVKGADTGTGYSNDAYTFNCTASGGTSHNILSATHTDTSGAGAEVRGDLFVRNSGGFWTRLPVGAAGTVIHGSATDPVYSAIIDGDFSGQLGVAHGGTGVAAAGDDQVLVGNGTSFALTTIPQCNIAGSALLYDQASNTFTCYTPAKPLPKIAGLPKQPCNAVRRTDCQ